MFMKTVACLLVALTFALGVAPRVDAGFAPSQALSGADRATDLENIRFALENKLVAQRLKDLGFSESEIYSRLSRMDDSEVHGLAQKLDDIRAGGNGLGIVIALLVIAILVVLLLQLTGHRVVIK